MKMSRYAKWSWLALVSVLTASIACLTPSETKSGVGQGEAPPPAKEQSPVKEPPQAKQPQGGTENLSWNDLGSKVGPAVVTASIQGAANEHTPPCGVSPPPGSDLTYRWTAPATGTYVFTTSSTDFDTLFYIQDINGAVQGCNPDESSAMVVDLTAGGVYFLVVDSASVPPSPSAIFTLNICSLVLCNAPPGSQDCYNAGICAFNGACSYTPKPVGTSCNDGNACTTGDACNATGSCAGTAVSCNNPPSTCHQGTCNASTGQCSYALKPAGASCSDGLSCTGNDKCDSAGNCRGSSTCTPKGKCWDADCTPSGCVQTFACGPDEYCTFRGCEGRR